VLWMFTAVVFVAFYTAQLSASLTAQQIRGSINGPQDLVGRHVGTTRASTAAVYLSENKAQVHEFVSIDAVYDALRDKEVDAVVFDAPAILYYATHDGKGLAQVVGGVFHKEDYGIVFPTDSPLRKQVNEALLALRENGRYQRFTMSGSATTRRDPRWTSGPSSATGCAGDAIGQCEIPLGPNWLFRFNRQRGVQLGQSSYRFTAVAASDPLQS
jgi:hypothetical protein